MLLLIGTIACGQYALHAQPRGLTPPQSSDTTAWNNYFAAWEAASPKDARLWIDRFNHLFNRSRHSVMVLRTAGDTEPQPGESPDRLILQDSTGAEAGSLSERVEYDESLLARAVEAIDHGIALHPDRLDMRLGRAAAFMHAGKYDRMVESLCVLTDRAEQNNGQWTGADGTTAQTVTPKELIADYLQDYANTLFDALSSEPDDPASAALGRLAEREAAYCSESPVALNNVAVWHYTAGRPEEGLRWFIRASEADPDDALIILNIGRLYASLGDAEQARTWWTKLLKFPDKTYREQAGGLLKQLDGASAR